MQDFVLLFHLAHTRLHSPSFQTHMGHHVSSFTRMVEFLWKIDWIDRVRSVQVFEERSYFAWASSLPDTYLGPHFTAEHVYEIYYTCLTHTKYVDIHMNTQTHQHCWWLFIVLYKCPLSNLLCRLSAIPQSPPDSSGSLGQTGSKTPLLEDF